MKKKFKYKLANGQILYCSVKRVSISISPHNRKSPDTIETNLAVARYGKKDGYLYLYCDFKDSHLNDYETVVKALKDIDAGGKLKNIIDILNKSLIGEKTN